MPREEAREAAPVPTGGDVGTADVARAGAVEVEAGADGKSSLYD